MRTLILTITTVFIFLFNTQDNIKTGDVYIINEVESLNYNYIDLPRLNTLIKKGSVANYKSIVGIEVVVESVIKKDDNTTEVVLKRKDGKKFFNYLPTVSANLEKAVEKGELTFKN